jgi:peptide deformylase
MAARDIVTMYSNNRDVLKRKSTEVFSFDDNLWSLLDDLRETLDENPGQGLAAPQIGESLRAIVLNDGPYRELVNPVITWSKGSETLAEGCLSLPGLSIQVSRANKIVVDAVDRHGNPIHLRTRGPVARLILHEIDHLNGILIVDRAKQ